MLLQRMILFTVFTANTSGNPNVNLLAISVSSILMSLWQTFLGRIYKNWINWLLEGFYSANLALFTSAILFLNTSQGTSEALTCVIVGTCSACVIFCLVIMWHFNQQTRACSSIAKKLKQLVKQKRTDRPQDLIIPTPLPQRQPQPTISIIDMRKLRVPLLTEN